jgi:hypothetical protein
VIRRGRRKIRNEEEFLRLVEEAGWEWCVARAEAGAGTGGESCAVRVERVFFGESASSHNIANSSSGSINSSGSDRIGPRSGLGGVERDVLSLQHLAVLVGVQGSGMLNALYTCPASTVLALYLNDGWPISSGDPLGLIAHRGPYLRHINRDSSKVICEIAGDKVHKNKSNHLPPYLLVSIEFDSYCCCMPIMLQYCDSGDIVLDADTYKPLLLKALAEHQSACDKVWN